MPHTVGRSRHRTPATDAGHASRSREPGLATRHAAPRGRPTSGGFGTTFNHYSDDVLHLFASLPLVATLDVASGALLVLFAGAIAWASLTLLLRLFKSHD
jgi:hypothetical protein